MGWFDLEKRDNEDWHLSLPIPDVFGPLIDEAFPELDHIGWRPSRNNPGVGFTFIKLYDDNDPVIEGLRDFLQVISPPLLILTKSGALADEFDDELDFCFALDMNFVQPESGERTHVGGLEFRAKWRDDAASLDELARLMAGQIASNRVLASADLIASIPGNPGKATHIPDELVDQIADLVDDLDVVQLQKTVVTQELKTLALEDKLQVLQGAFACPSSVRGKSVLLIDDLYQSGSTMWRVAQVLKAQGARKVYGLACVKSWRDSGNV